MFAHIQNPAVGPVKRNKLDLMGIRFAEGENGGAPAVTPPAPATPSAPATPPADPPADQSAPWTKENFDPERAQKLVENLRGDIAAEKDKREQAIAAAVEKSQKELLTKFGAAFGFGEAEKETDPEKLAAALAEKNTALTTAQTAVKDGQRATQVALLAHGLGANAALLLKNEAFKTSIASVEPTDEAALQSAITKAVQETPALKATPARSGSGEHQGPTIQSLESQLAAAQKAGDVVESIRLKQAIAAARRA